MTLTRDFKKTVVERVERDTAFAEALLDEAATLFLSGEPDTARLILRDLVNATVGFESLAELTHKPSKSLHRMLSPKGNPSMDNLAVIFGAVKNSMKVSVAGLVVGKPYLLPLSCFRASKFNARVFYAQDDIDMTAQSIRSNGQDVPVLGYVQDDHVVIIDGQKRFTACNTGQIEKLLAYIVDKPESPAEEYEMSRRINLERTSQTPFDDAVRFKELLDQKVYPDQKQMAGRLGLSEETLSRTMQLSLIPPVFRRMMAEHPTSSTLSIAYELSRLSKEAPKFGDNFDALFEEVIATVNKKELSRIATRALVESKLTGPRTRAQSNSVPFDFGGKQGLIKTIPAKGEFNLSITGLSPENIEKLGVKIRDLVASME